MFQFQNYFLVLKLHCSAFNLILYKQFYRIFSELICNSVQHNNTEYIITTLQFLQKPRQKPVKIIMKLYDNKKNIHKTIKLTHQFHHFLLIYEEIVES